MKPGAAAKAISAGVRKILTTAQRQMLDAAHFGAEAIARNAPVDVGTVKSSVHVEGLVDPRIVVDAPHAAVLELGSRPHTPPLQPLIDWVRRHRKSFGVARARRGSPSAAAADAEIVRIAVAIQRKIAREGTKPRYFVRDSIPAILEYLKREFAK